LFDDVPPYNKFVSAFHTQGKGHVEWEVKERPDLLAYVAKMLHFDVIEVELIDEVLKLRSDICFEENV
jgi:hypothetical protein